MNKRLSDSSPQTQSFSGRSMLYTIYRHHHGLSHEQTVRRIEAELETVLAASAARRQSRVPATGSSNAAVTGKRETRLPEGQ